MNARPPFRLHACTPPGTWINDPNALFHAGGRYQLLAQFCDETDPRRIGWGRFTSANLFDWQWEGVAIAATNDASAYSGSVVAANGGWEAWLTRHRDDPRLETQHVAWSADGIAWDEDPQPRGPQGRNMRDPFVWQAGDGDWRMLVAEPCDWTKWHEDPPSQLQLWQSPDRRSWRPAGTIGPWHPPGVMWEVPVVVDFGDTQMLVLSLVDRRGDTTSCATRYWLGRIDNGFARAPGFPEAGLPLDLGPDFYAAIPNTPGGWPSEDRVLVAWASTWEFARAYRWEGDRRGGPITLPRRLWHQSGRVRQAPWGGQPMWSGTLDAHFVLSVRRGDGFATIASDASGVSVERRGAPGFDWRRDHPDVVLAEKQQIAVHVDGDLVEVFIAPAGVTVTVAFPCAGDYTVSSGSTAPA